MKPTITIGLACDGFRISFNGNDHFVNQEDDQQEKLKEIFEKLGYHVELEDDF